MSETIPVPPEQAEASLAINSHVNAGEMLTLSLDDLVPDSRGEIVILSAGDHDINVITDQPVAKSGIDSVQPHLTETGLDVSGFAYCTFADGVTVFCPSAHRLTVLNEA